MAPDRARFLLEILLPQLESEQAITQKLLSSVPPDSGDFRPATKNRSAFELARHIAVVDIWFLDAVVDRRFGELPPLPDTVRTCQDIAQWYAENFMCRLQLLKQLSGEDLATDVDFIGLRKDPAVAYLSTAIRHTVHHRGQLSAYLPSDGRVGTCNLCGKRRRALSRTGYKHQDTPSCFLRRSGEEDLFLRWPIKHSTPRQSAISWTRAG
jgi:uncharacterized damage-inducible protein DinB